MIKYQKIIMIRIKDKLKCVYFINYVSTLDIIELLMHYSIRGFFYIGNRIRTNLYLHFILKHEKKIKAWVSREAKANFNSFVNQLFM